MKNKVCFIIAGGPSFSRIPIKEIEQYKDKVRIIVVNDAANYIKFAHEVFTLDTKQLRKRYDKATQINPKIKKVACLPDGFDLPLPSNLIKIRRLPSSELSDIKRGIRTGNSGVGAYEYAILTESTHIFLFGIDMTKESNKNHWYKAEKAGFHHEALHHWDKAIKIDNTYLVNKESGVNCFKKIDWEECKELCSQLLVS